MSFNYGSRNYSEGAYGGKSDSYNNAGKTAVMVEVYDNDGLLKGLHQTGVDNFIGCRFTITPSGSQDFILFFASYVNIEKKDIIKIRLFNSLDYLFTGVVRRIPIDGSTEANYNYSGFGLIDYFIRANTESRTYSVVAMQTIIDDLVNNILLTKTPINRNDAKINPPVKSVRGLDLNYVSCKNAFSQLKALAQYAGQEYVVGVDGEGDFFFKPRSAEVKVTLVVGKKGRYGIEIYEPKDSIEERTKYFVLDKDGNYVTTVNSSIANDVYEDKLVAPDIHANDIQNWANGILTEKEITTRTATIDWTIEDVNPTILVADGNIRIISNIAPARLAPIDPHPYGTKKYGEGLYGGAAYEGRDLTDELRVMQVVYTVNANVATRTIQLGGKAIKLEDEILTINQDIEMLRTSLGR